SGSARTTPRRSSASSCPRRSPRSAAARSRASTSTRPRISSAGSGPRWRKPACSRSERHGSSARDSPRTVGPSRTSPTTTTWRSSSTSAMSRTRSPTRSSSSRRSRPLLRSRPRRPARSKGTHSRGREGHRMDEGTELTLEHWIYGASPEKGYGMKAESHRLNGPLYMRYLASHFTPVRVEKTANGGTLIDARMIHPAPANDEVLLSVLGRGTADEYNRPTIQNHTVVIPGATLRDGRLTYFDVEAAVLEFDHRFPKAGGKVDPLVLQPRPPPEASQPVGNGIRRLITKAAVDTLASRFLSDQQGRTLVLCRGSTNHYRNELLYRLMELLAAGGEISVFPAISD